MKDLGKALAVGLTAIAAGAVICVLRTEASMAVMAAPCVVAFFAYVMNSDF